MAYFSDRIVSFPKLVIAAAAIYAGAVTLAHAELVCNIQDKGGNQLTYVFGPNTTNTQATFGTLVEELPPEQRQRGLRCWPATSLALQRHRRGA